jgi:nucleoside-diphosphate-sugar epimerase
MKALVTGATGFVGGHVIEALLRQKDTVTALVRRAARGPALADRGVRVMAGDLGQPDALRAACDGQDVVYHIAGLVAARSEAEFLAVNRTGTERLVEAARDAKVRRFVLLSSLAAGGPTEPGRPLSGDEPPRPTTQYGRSKLAGETVVRASALEWTIVRPPAVYGPGDREMFRVFRAARLGIAPVFGTGAQALSLVYGPDLADAITAAGRSAATAGRVFYACHPEILSSRALVETVGRAAGRRVRVVAIPPIAGRAALWLTEWLARLRNRPTVLTRDKANEFFQPAWICDPTPLTEVTGWRATHDLAAGARATYDWYRRAGWL